MIHVPTREEFAAFLEARQELDGAILTTTALRDIVRMIEIAHLVDEQFLGDELVLGGGMAMRLRGSTRLTMFDTDLSATPRDDLSVDEVRDVLELQDEQLTIVPIRVEPRVDLITAYPVRFTFTRPPADIARGDQIFKVDLATRGVELPPEWVELRHDYPFELGIEGTSVPIMALLEAVAEKAVSYGIYRPPKHYADLAFAADVFQAELIAGSDEIREIAAVKFAGNKERFSRLLEGQGIGDFDSMLPSFESNRYLATIKYSWTSEVRFVGEASLSYSFSEASRLVNERIVPILFPRRAQRR